MIGEIWQDRDSFFHFIVLDENAHFIHVMYLDGSNYKITLNKRDLDKHYVKVA